MQNTVKVPGKTPKYNWTFPSLALVAREEGFGAHRRRSGYTRRRTGEEMWSDEEDEDAGYGGGASEDEYGEDSEEGYYSKLGTAYRKLVVSTLTIFLCMSPTSRSGRQAASACAHRRLRQWCWRRRCCEDHSFPRRGSSSDRYQYRHHHTWRSQQRVWRRLRQDLSKASPFTSRQTRSRTARRQLRR